MKQNIESINQTAINSQNGRQFRVNGNTTLISSYARHPTPAIHVGDLTALADTKHMYTMYTTCAYSKRYLHLRNKRHKLANYVRGDIFYQCKERLNIHMHILASVYRN